MRCRLLDLACHAQSAAWEWWSGVGLLNKMLIVLGLVLLIAAVLRSVLALVHKVGGWPAVVGAVAAIAGLVVAFLPRKPADDFTGGEDGDDEPAAPRKTFPVPPPKKKRKPRLLDRLKKARG